MKRSYRYYVPESFLSRLEPLKPFHWMKNHRVPPGQVMAEDCMTKLNTILKHFEGTHNFHNFTVHSKIRSVIAGVYLTEYSRYLMDDEGNEAKSSHFFFKRNVYKAMCTNKINIQGEHWYQIDIQGRSFFRYGSTTCTYHLDIK